MKKVAITGGLACGKSSVCKLFKSFGAYVLSADDIVHQLLSPETNLGKQVIDLLGQEVMTETGQLDRKVIAQKVFSHPKLLQQLEAYLHPAVMAEIQRLYHVVKERDYSCFVVEVPLLFEAGMESFFNEVVVVTASKETARQRYSALGNDPLAFEQRTARQWGLSEKTARGHFVIDNDGTEENLEKEAQRVFKQITNLQP